ncbi:MAG: hypothetical protein MJY52_05580 [Bacteroidaceae bacterium]|nr:hypothetical protein [Bacteroidaceae bacterium]
MNFREALQSQSVNKFTLDVCTSSRLLKQYHKFCTQRAEAHLSGATQRKSNLSTAFARRGEIKSILLGNMVNAIVSHIKSLRSKQGLRLCSLRRIIGTAMPVRGVYKKTMANLFDDWLLRDYTYFATQNDDFSARNKQNRITEEESK